jgi:hypothetical protein
MLMRVRIALPKGQESRGCSYPKCRRSYRSFDHTDQDQSQREVRGTETTEDREDQRELEVRQQELEMRWRQFQLESKQVRRALHSAQSWKEYSDTLPEEERPFAMSDPRRYAKNKNESGSWALGLETLKKDPSLGATPDVINVIEQMGRAVGKPILLAHMKASTSGKFPNGIRLLGQQDGTVQLGGSRRTEQLRSSPAARGYNPCEGSLYRTPSLLEPPTRAECERQS